MRLSSLVWLIGILVIAGCNRSDRVPLGKVEGTVSYRGKPIAGGSLVFEVTGARSASGKIVSGKISEITTYDMSDGAPVGMARIAVFATVPVDPSKPPPPKQTRPGQFAPFEQRKSVIPEKYNNLATSGLTHKIEAGTNNIVLDLQ